MINKVTKNIILNAVKSHGRNIEKIMPYVNDKVTPREADSIKKFLGWSFTNREYLRHNNFDEALKDFSNLK